MNRSERRKQWPKFKNRFSGLTWWEIYGIIHPLDPLVREQRIKNRLESGKKVE